MRMQSGASIDAPGADATHRALQRLGLRAPADIGTRTRGRGKYLNQDETLQQHRISGNEITATRDRA